MTVLSTFCSTFPRVSRTVATRFDTAAFDLRVVRVFALAAGRTAFFVEGDLVVGGATWLGGGGSIVSGDDGDLWAIRAADTESAITITFTAMLTGRSAGASRRLHRGLADPCPERRSTSDSGAAGRVIDS